MAVASDKEKEIHHLILNGDAIALSKLFDLYGDYLIKVTKRRYPKCAKSDASLIVEAVNEGLLGYFRNPRTFNPELNTLKRFLEIASERDLKNLLEKNAKHTKGRIEVSEDVELEENFWNRVKKDNGSADDSLINEETIRLVTNELERHFDNQIDVEMAKLILSSERATATFAELLDITDLNDTDQQEEVKRNKDRIKKVLDRNNVEEAIKNWLQ